MSHLRMTSAEFQARTVKKPKYGIAVVCESCGIDFEKFPSNAKRVARHFCSIECRRIGTRQHNHPNWKGGRRIDQWGYVILRLIEDGKSIEIYEHRHLMQKLLGRKLDTNEHVHHIDGNRTNNAVQNLEVLTNSEHQKEHGKKWDGIWSKTHSSCVECGTTKMQHHGRGLCNTCWHRIYSRERRAAK